MWWTPLTRFASRTAGTECTCNVIFAFTMSLQHHDGCGRREKKIIKVKKSLCRPGQAPTVPGRWGSQSSRNSGTWNRQGCQLYASAVFTTQEKFLVLVSVRGCVDPMAIVRPEGCHWKISNDPIGNWFLWLPALCPRQCSHTALIILLHEDRGVNGCNAV